MKYLAILKDSFRETLDTKVFYFTVAISLLIVLFMATLSLEPNSPEQGLTNLANRFPDGGFTQDAVVEYKTENVKNLNEASKPWNAEFRFEINATDKVPRGFRSIVLIEGLQEEAKLSATSDKKTRYATLVEDINEYAKSHKREETQRYITRRIEEEARKLSEDDLKKFVRHQLEKQGNWDVTEVKMQPVEVIQVRVPELVEVGDERVIKLVDADAEKSTFEVTIKSRSGTFNVWPHKATLMFGTLTLTEAGSPGNMMYLVQSYLIGSIGATVVVLLSCIITAFYIPNMLHKGTIDLLLAKPINRFTLLFYKYIGGLTFMFLNTVVLVGGLWLVMGWRTGIWSVSFLIMIVVLTLQFALFYAFSTLTSVLTRSAIASILACVMLWVATFVIGWTYRAVESTKDPTSVAALLFGDPPNWLRTTVSITHAVTPHYKDLDVLGSKVLWLGLIDPTPSQREQVEKDYAGFRWDESILSIFVYIAIFLGLATLRFATKDY